MKKKIIATTIATTVLLTTVPLTGEFAEKAHVSTIQVEAASKVIYKATVTSKSLTVRTTKSLTSKKLGTKVKGKTVSVVSKSGAFSQIKFNKGYGWVTTKSLKQITNATLITNAPKKLKKTIYPYSDSVVRAIDVEQASLVNQTATWNIATKKKQLKNVANATGMNYSETPSRINLAFVDVGKVTGDPNFDSSSIEIWFSGKEILININDSRMTLLKEGEYVLQTILRPYFPKSYKKIASMFYDDHYIHAGNRFLKPKKYDGLNLYLVGGEVRFWK